MEDALSKQQARAILWSKGILTFKLDAVQKELYDIYLKSTYKTVVWSCARRVGKSWALCVIAIEQCLKNPNNIVKFIAPSAKHVRTIIKPLFREILKDCPKAIKPEFRTAEMIFRFPNGSEVQLAGTDSGHAESLRGGSADLCIVDEAGFCDDLRYIVQSILIPTTTTTRGKIILSSTPPKSPDHEFVNYMKEAEYRGTFIKKTIYDNPRLSKDVIQEIIQELGGEDSPDFQREYLCKIIIDEEHAVVPEFNEALEKEIVREWPMPPFFDIYVGGDIGFKDLTVFLFSYYDFRAGKLIILDELVMNGKKMTTDFMAKQIKIKEEVLFTHPLTGEKQEPYLRVCDNNLIVINDLYRLHGLLFQPTAKDDAQAALNNMRIMLGQGNIIIHPRCKTLIYHLKNATWAKNRKTYDRSPDAGHYDACFLPNSDVMTSRGVVPIQDIKPGDKVLTHKGNFKPVKELLSRPYQGKILEVKSFGRPSIFCTPDHKFLASSLSRSRTEGRTGQLILGNFDWVEAKNLVISSNFSHKSGLSAPICETKRNLNISNEMCFLYGYYVAEGSCGGNGYQIEFAGHKKEKNVGTILNEAVVNTYGFSEIGSSRRSKTRHLAQEIKYRARKPRFSYSPTSEGRKINITNKHLYVELKKLGKGVDKHFPDWIYQLDEIQAFYMLSGYLFGDGNFTEGSIRAGSISKQIIYGIELLSLKCGISGSIGLAKRAGRWKGLSKSGLIENDMWTIGYDNIASYSVNSKINSLNDLNFVFQDKTVADVNIKNISSIPPNIKTIDFIKELDYSGLVYSMEVQDDHSYTINGLAVKNCDATKYLVRNIQLTKNPYPSNYGLGSKDATWFNEDNKPLPPAYDVIKSMFKFKRGSKFNKY